MADLRFIRKTAIEKGLSINYISKEEKISNLLFQLSNICDKNFIIKGGTAINRGYLQKNKFNRFSEDIDIDYICNKKVNQRIKDIKKIINKITFFDIKKERLLHRTLRFDCYYINELNHKDRIMIEFYLSHNRLLCSSKPEKKLLKSNFIETNPCNFTIYSFEDLIARKIVALYRRLDGKDIYDVFYSLLLDFDIKKVKKSLKLLLNFYKIEKDYKEVLMDITEKLKDNQKNKLICYSTNHFIPKHLRPDWKMLILTLRHNLNNLIKKF
jgi:predicted nucleotidyltransferase component of viral defense system